MNMNAAGLTAGHRVRHAPIAPMATVVLALSLGLCAGFLDASELVAGKYFWNSEGHFRTARDFPWTVPLGHAALMVVPGVLVAGVNRFRPASISLRAAARLFVALSLWSALLRTPLSGTCSLLFAVGTGRVVGDAIAAHGLRPRQARLFCVGLLLLVAVFAGLTSGWQAIEEYRAVAGLSPAPVARNVILIVWDTVRATSVGLYGNVRDTSPNLARWAQRGVTYKYALSPAPWTLPAHASFFTGKWPIELNTQLKLHFDEASPTLAEDLTASGYQTAGFAANTNWCSYETGLARGFIHFDDYPLTPISLLGRTVPGQWILKTIFELGSLFDPSWMYYTRWIDLQSRGAREINDSFFQWLGRRRLDRPFFAFLNYFDAHDPYLPPPGYEDFSGNHPATFEQFQFLINFGRMDKTHLSARDIATVGHCYDDCIAFLDEQLGLFLDRLQAQGLLENTDVIITSDHGEAFGTHHYFGHDNTVNLEEIVVPLVILSPGAPAGRVVENPVSLRDIPATVLELLGLQAASRFPGRSLSAYWKLAPGETSPSLTSPAFSEKVNKPVFEILADQGRRVPGFEMSLVASGHHYIRDSLGNEQLYDLSIDPLERFNLTGPDSDKEEVGIYRKKLSDVLAHNMGSNEVEMAYLATYRRWLEDLVREKSSRTLSAKK